MIFTFIHIYLFPCYLMIIYFVSFNADSSYSLQMNGDNTTYQKNTTFTKRPGLPQIASYLVFSLQTALFYGVVLPHLRPTTQAAFAVLYSLALLTLIVSTISASAADPSDRVMIQYRNHPREEFQTFRRGLTMKLLFCDYCRSFVRERSRHCRACDRCVQDFDHHCMWINNCVGGINYRAFFVMILAAFVNLLLYVLALITLTLQDSTSNYLPAFAAAWVSGGINSVFVILLINLILLHLYLLHKGISTYEFIMLQREQERKQKQAMNQDQRELPRVDSQKVAEISSGREQSIHGQIEMKEDSSSHNVIRIRSMEKAQEESNSNDSHQHPREEEKEKHQLPKSVIFGHNDLTEKSQNSEQPNPHEQLQLQNEGDSQGESSIELSQLFTRNKSLKFIIGKNQFYRPHRTSRDNRDSKSKSMFARQEK